MSQGEEEEEQRGEDVFPQCTSGFSGSERKAKIFFFKPKKKGKSERIWKECLFLSIESFLSLSCVCSLENTPHVVKMDGGGGGDRYLSVRRVHDHESWTWLAYPPAPSRLLPFFLFLPFSH